MSRTKSALIHVVLTSVQRRLVTNLRLIGAAPFGARPGQLRLTHLALQAVPDARSVRVSPSPRRLNPASFVIGGVANCNRTAADDEHVHGQAHIGQVLNAGLRSLWMGPV